MVDLNAAGQTTIIYKLKLGEMVTTIMEIGRKMETVEYKFRSAAAGGQDRIQRRRRQYYRRTHGPVYTVGSDDPDRIEETNEELIKMLNEDEMCDAVVMFSAKKQGAWCDDGG